MEVGVSSNRPASYGWLVRHSARCRVERRPHTAESVLGNGACRSKPGSRLENRQRQANWRLTTCQKASRPFWRGMQVERIGNALCDGHQPVSGGTAQSFGYLALTIRRSAPRYSSLFNEHIAKWMKSSSGTGRQEICTLPSYNERRLLSTPSETRCSITLLDQHTLAFAAMFERVADLCQWSAKTSAANTSVWELSYAGGSINQLCRYAAEQLMERLFFCWEQDATLRRGSSACLGTSKAPFLLRHPSTNGQFEKCPWLSDGQRCRSGPAIAIE